MKDKDMDGVLSSAQIKESRERFYLDGFLSSYGINFKNIERGDDPPDFIVKTDKIKIAVEVTDFHSDETGSTGHPRRLIEEEWAKLQSLINEERERHPDLKRTNCWIEFKTLELPPRNKSQSFVNQLLDFCLEKFPDLTSCEVDFYSFGTGYELLNKYVREISIQLVDRCITWEWNHSGGWAGLTEEELEDCIRKKMQASKPGGVDENWLLIVSGHQISQTIGLISGDLLNSYHIVTKTMSYGPYDKVFIFQYMHDRILMWNPKNGWIEERPATITGTISE